MKRGWGRVVGVEGGGVEIIIDIICPTSEEDSCIWFLLALPDRDPVFMK